MAKKMGRPTVPGESVYVRLSPEVATQLNEYVAQQNTGIAKVSKTSVINWALREFLKTKGEKKMDRDWNELWKEGNNAGEGYAIGDGENVSVDDVNSVVGYGELIQRAYSDRDVAVYDNGNHYVLVGNSNGLWAVNVNK